MEPRSLDRGKESGLLVHTFSLRASMEPRSLDRGKGLGQHDPLGPVDCGFNGAAVSRPRKAPFTIVMLLLATRFNGAAVSRPRKGPISSSRRRQDQPGFNGAAVSRPRKELTCCLPVRLLSLLQWSRGLSTAERSSRAP